MARSCLRWAIFYVVLGASLAVAFYLRFPVQKTAAIVGFIAAIPVWMGVAYLLGTRHAEGRVIAHAMKGGALKDGEKVGVIGRIASSTEMLESAVTGRRCVAFEYKFLTAGGEGAVGYEGFHMRNARIEGPGGSVKILAYPELAFPEEQLHEQQHYRKAKEYVERTTFTEVTGIEIKKEFARLKTMLADDDGKIDSDIHRQYLANISRAGGTSTGGINDFFLREKTLVPGEEVCAVGLYSAARGGLVPDSSAILFPVKILKGDPRKIVGQMRRGHARDILLGFGCLIPVVLGAFIALIVVPLTAIEQMLPEKDASWKEIEFEEMLQRKVRPRVKEKTGYDSGIVPVQLNREEVRGKFAVGEQSTPLTWSYATHDAGSSDVWLNEAGTPPRGVQLRIRDDGRVESIRILGGETIRPANLFADYFKQDDTEVIGRVTYLEPDKRFRLHAMFRAPITGKPAE